MNRPAQATATADAVAVAEPSRSAVFELEDVVKVFGGGRRFLRGGSTGAVAVDSVSLDVFEGQTVGIVGESGSGKSTLARIMVDLHGATSGSVRFRGTEIADVPNRSFRRQVQYVFQDPYSSLNPRKSIGKTITEVLTKVAGLDGAAARQRLDELIGEVGLRAELADRYPHELSGGQRQRVGIARALATGATTLILDEPVSALDVSVQAQILSLLHDLKGELDLTYVFIAHDLAVVESISDVVAVMYRGRLLEYGTADQVFNRPSHPYTRNLLEAVPVPGKRSRRERAAAPAAAPTAGDLGAVADPLEAGDAGANATEDTDAGDHACSFSPRCPLVQDRCRSERPPAVPLEAPHTATCFEIDRLPVWSPAR
ncbi:MAG: ATP-binding cassette domain-containing protein [Actinomycetota bacterium]|nr:ATP-binding cassette domain-containing protein [Actinomycetota bacterium]